mmetsp:Transcript_39246/g.95994  ORF Transcript_39246/g.95994 Transcript_39246/m.95994 type:complete len:98 (-) Transcript_39246:1198-1491(-)
MTSKEDSLGVQATKVATEVAAKWLDDAYQVINKQVMDTAKRGLFHCKIRFTDVVPQDRVNQARLLKLLQRDGLHGSFRAFEATDSGEAGVELIISWG